MRRPALAIAFLASLTLAPAAPAAWYPGETLTDGVTLLGGVDVGRDGDGAVAYVKAAGAYVSRKVDGAWRAPERVDGGVGGEVTEVALGAGEGGRLALAFAAGGAVYGTIAPEGETPQPFTAPVPLAPAGGVPAGLHADLGPNGYAYATWAAEGDVRAARAEGTQWTPIPEPLDIDPARPAGDGTARPRVAVGADGNAMVVWGEEDPSGRVRVYERRLLGTRLSRVPQQASLPELLGVPGGSSAWPEIDMEDDSSFAQVTWVQEFGGTTRALMRRLVGSAFEAPALLDDGAAASIPDAAVDGRGQGHAIAATADGRLLGWVLDDEEIAPAERVDGLGAATDPVTAVGELGERVAAWRSGAEIRGRFGIEEDPLGPEAVLSDPSLPPAGAPVVASDLAGDAVVAFLQGDRLVAADHDREPGQPTGGTSTRWKPVARPELRWRAGTELWGPVSYTAIVDGVEVGTTGADRLRVPSRLPDGEHAWAVRATDRRGQTSVSETMPLRVDKGRPRVRLKVRGVRRPGLLLRARLRARDRASGVATFRLELPDGRVITDRTRARFRVPAGTHRVRAVVNDVAGNVTRKRVRLLVR